MNSSNGTRRAKVRAWFGNLSRINQVVVTVATTIVTLVTLGGILWAGYQRLVDVVEPDARKQTEWLGIEVWQRGEPNDIYAVGDDPFQRRVEVPMEQEPFQLRLPAQDENTAIQVCAWKDDSIFTLEIEEPTELEPCFQPGTGIAVSDANANVMLILDKQAHNHFTGDRMSSTSEHEVINVQAVAYRSNYSIVSEPTPIDELTHDLFLVVFIDTDIDERVDSDEYHFLQLNFPEGN